MEVDFQNLRSPYYLSAHSVSMTRVSRFTIAAGLLAVALPAFTQNAIQAPTDLSGEWRRLTSAAGTLPDMAQPHLMMSSATAPCEASPSPPGITGVYQRHAYADEMRDALSRWEAHLTKLLQDSDHHG